MAAVASIVIQVDEKGAIQAFKMLDSEVEKLGPSFRKAGSAGNPALHCELKVVDEGGAELPPGSDGEILVRGPNVATGYWNARAETAAVQDDFDCTEQSDLEPRR